MKKRAKAGTQRKALAPKLGGVEAVESGDSGAPIPESPSRRMPFTKAKTNNFTMEGRKTGGF